MADWTSNVVEVLARARARGMDFDQAWEAAVELYPPRRLDSREPRTLLDEDGKPHDCTLVEFTRLACSDAWHGRSHPCLGQLRHLMEMLVDDDRSRSAVPGRGRLFEVAA